MERFQVFTEIKCSLKIVQALEIINNLHPLWYWETDAFVDRQAQNLPNVHHIWQKVQAHDLGIEETLPRENPPLDDLLFL